MTLAKDQLTKHVDEDVVFGFDFGPKLPSSVTVVGSPTITTSPPGLTVSGGAVNSSIFTDNDGVTTIAANEGVTALFSGGKSGRTYKVVVVVNDSAGNPKAITAFMRVVG